MKARHINSAWNRKAENNLPAKLFWVGIGLLALLALGSAGFFHLEGNIPAPDDSPVQTYEVR